MDHFHLPIHCRGLSASSYFIHCHTNHVGACESLRNPKLTNLLKSENTLSPGRFASPTLDPVGGPLSGGDDSPEKMPSLGALIILGLTMPPCDAVGSMSSDDRNEVLSSSLFVLVIVRNESNRSFCWNFGVPFRSRICSKGQRIDVERQKQTRLLEVGEGRIANEERIIQDETLRRVLASRT